MSDLTKKSKFLSYILRHKPEEIRLELSKEGWGDINVITSNSDITKSELIEIVSSDNKGRYEIDLKKNLVRAVQGHSTKEVNLTFEEIIPPDVLFHGTSKTNYKKIIQSGEILPGSRHHVHLSGDITTASKVGSRHGDLKIITIDSARMSKDGIKFFKSNNGVFLVNSVSAKYFIYN